MVDDLPADALTKRLGQAKATGQTELLQSLGVSTVDELKAALAVKREAEEAKRSDAEKLENARKEIDTLKSQVAEQEKSNAAIWQSESEKLTPEQVAAVEALSNKSAASRLNVLAALRPTWQAPATAAATTPPAAQTPPVPAPQANTSPVPAAPAPAGTTSPTDHTAVWEGLKKSNPIVAAQYLIRYQSSISSPK